MGDIGIAQRVGNIRKAQVLPPEFESLVESHQTHIGFGTNTENGFKEPL